MPRDWHWLDNDHRWNCIIWQMSCRRRCNNLINWHMDNVKINVSYIRRFIKNEMHMILSSILYKIYPKNCLHVFFTLHWIVVVGFRSTFPLSFRIIIRLPQCRWSGSEGCASMTPVCCFGSGLALAQKMISNRKETSCLPLVRPGFEPRRLWHTLAMQLTAHALREPTKNCSPFH